MIQKKLVTNPKIKLFFGIPIVLIAVLFVKELSDGIGQYRDIAVVRESVQISAFVGELIHEMQKERGMSAGYLGSQGAKFKESLAVQRKLVDERYSDFRSYVLENPPRDVVTAENTNFIVETIKSIEHLRQQVDSLAATRKEAVAYYTSMVRAGLDSIHSLSQECENARLSRNLLSYNYLLEAKERLGIERALLSNAFGMDKFTPDLFQAFVSRLAEHKAFLGKFKVSAPLLYQNKLAESLDPATLENVQQFEDLAFSKMSGFNTDPEVWFDAQTQKIDQFKAAETFIKDELLASSTRILHQTLIGLVFFLLLFAVGVAMVFKLIQASQQSLKLVYSGIEAMAQGNLAHEIPLKSKDTIGKMASKIEEMRLSFKAIVTDLKRAAEEGEVLSANLQRGAAEIQISSNEVADQTSEMAAGVIQMTSSAKSMEEAVFQNKVEMEAIVEQIAASTQRVLDINSAGEAMVASMEGVVGATKEMEGSLEKIAADSVRSAEMIASSLDTAGEIHKVMQQLQEKTKAIDSFVAVIEKIANQTNLLSLNATIEAARAKEAGKGFAVVAHEVKTLSFQTTESAQDIGRQVAEIKGGVMAMKEIFDSFMVTLEDNRSFTNNLAASIEEQSAVVQDINQRMSELDQSIHQVNDNLGQLEASMQKSEQATSSSEQKMAQISEQIQENSAVTSQMEMNLSQVKGLAMNAAEETRALEEVANNMALQAQRNNDLVERFILDSDALEESIVPG